jgi:phage portal protein BeeE
MILKLRRNKMMKLKEDINEEEITSTIDNEGFWYAITDGGWIKPKEVLANEDDIKKVEDAIAVIREFEDSLPEL